MGCVTSKQTVSVTPALDHSGAFRGNAAGAARSREKKKRAGSGLSGSELGESGRPISTIAPAAAAGRGGCENSLSYRLGNVQKCVEAEQVAAGWPAWLSAVAGEAIQGWVPLRPDSFEKLEKIGQGTYSSVFRARELGTGRIVALKKVRLDNFEPETVRFMAREIMILRRLDHPNVIKLEGLVTSRLSCSIYLVFQYMEHDISGLLSCPDAKFSEEQIKCYMHQLLSGLEYCHSRGVMHRDIKGSNILVNNDGILKIADFGLATLYKSFPSRLKQPLTNRVVTLWYRPPELLMGSTDYEPSVDLWSVGCVFAELLLGRPILKGRTEVEQIHKIFKLCGSPPEDYWRRSKLPHAMLYKPQLHYESSLGETFKDLPNAAVSLIETLLSVQPRKRGTASSALASQYFTTKPYACDPSSLPKYPPSKDRDARRREEAQRKKAGGRVRVPETRTKATGAPNGIRKLTPTESLPDKTQSVDKADGNEVWNRKERNSISGMDPPKSSIDVMKQASYLQNSSQGEVPYSAFAWSRRQIDDSSGRSSSRNLVFETSGALRLKNNFNSKRNTNVQVVHGSRDTSQDEDSSDTIELAVKPWSQLDRPDSFDASYGYHSRELSVALYQRENVGVRRISSAGLSAPRLQG
ncbi:protein IMPAIRED IN BABA-INDUCED STERILITY 1-like isoform X2 [Diospyros lotus]|uniref:protein IMPAIRED IN BABA-INDUCED STERILITY 1-like isoform X2 n=1 Tax=Diospyros lotus TaxID=55363 RepID=UPI002258E8A4|nr:protein IMPAIRED IN BABA-INDUCED STERILITY 1-like isoform X2 [Diospyros lotus]